MVLLSDSNINSCKLDVNSDGKLYIDQYYFNRLHEEPSLPKPNDKFSAKINKYLEELNRDKNRKEAHFESVQQS